MPRLHHILCSLISISYCFSSHAAEEVTQWDQVRLEGLTPGKSYAVASGTGFYVAPDAIVTNAHVVERCLTISIRGAVPPTRAELIAKDTAQDLALLRTNTPPQHIAYLRSNSGVADGDYVFVIGYPLEHAESGNYLLANAKVVEIDAPFEQATRIEITHSVEHGNSGGPLIDRSGNVIGVIVAKSTSFTQEINPTSGEVIQSDKEVRGVAIGLPVLKAFLSKYNVYFRANSTYDIFTEYRPDKRAREYVVNIHCVQEK